MNLLADLDSFVHDHHPHGGMTGDATEPASNGYRLTVACACGVVNEPGREGDGDLAQKVNKAPRISVGSPSAAFSLRSDR